MNWNDPQERFALIERIGIERYNQQFEAYIASSGPIREMQTRFGRLFAVEGTRQAFSTLAEAQAFHKREAFLATRMRDCKADLIK